MREAISMVARAFSLHDRDEWLRRFEGVEACVEPVLSLEEALAHPQAAAYRLDQPAGAALLQTIAPPLRLSATPVSQRREAPAPGQHNDEVLQEAGWVDSDIERLRTAGVLA